MCESSLDTVLILENLQQAWTFFPAATKTIHILAISKVEVDL